MPRRRPPRRTAARPLGGDEIEHRGSGAWHVRRLTGATTAKTYTCPGCHRPIPPGTAHVVAWPVEKALLSRDALDERRHWHRTCWERGR
ncbi:hypothetical protein HMPREF0063_12246 [Aeromicrobium marinum DSM 15272]|uniref:ATP/GTP-binding protein n=1 Tax=Aeromicrobium marinum DSM 15272 TaxID=585531 RepID=E2SCT4_9ACTN|nr:hypothetical protein [Aeromicrobium marinum]EFQ83037.1 hypothetical protein HMPREF0063_12246 [Aeromicrobium marinum DSM 15272]